ncbi:hypothetical protein GTY20_23030 [Streptomyces sp. SID4946]|nr:MULTISPECIES: hypothetical protein [unclassified Streptomyces]MYQ93957.1 hypothetical protein [Streptomyces sp. SID4946]
MDYCSECRRHLNGALVCPGCGAYAPDIAPPGTGGSPAGTAGPEVASFPWESEPAAEPFPGEPAAVASADVADAPVVREGRAARRRQLARWKKSQRRAVVATAVALVGGGLTLASMDRHNADRAQAATLPDDRSTGAAPQDEAPDQAHDPSATTGTRQAHHSAPTTRTPGGTGPVRQTLATHHHTAPANTHPDSAAPATPVTQPRPAGTRQAHTTTPRPRRPATPPAPPPPRRPPRRPPHHRRLRSGHDLQHSPARASTSPEQLCVLVLCIG